MDEKMKGFVAKDECGDVFLYSGNGTIEIEAEDVRKYDHCWVADTEKFSYTELPRWKFPDVRWSDEKPTEVEITIKTM